MEKGLEEAGEAIAGEQPENSVGNQGDGSPDLLKDGNLIPRKNDR